VDSDSRIESIRCCEGQEEMNSFRSKPLGWRYESQRHSLAARGISSKMKYFVRFKSKPYCPKCFSRDVQETPNLRDKPDVWVK
jgi:hypothetical protein